LNTPPRNISSPPLVVGFVNLGCPKNLIDGERMLASLALSGFVVTGDLDAADIGVVNTCGFIDAAREESGEVIDELIARKHQGRLQMVIVAGCYPQRSKEEILQNWPDVDAIIGLSARDQVGRIIRSAVRQHSDQPLIRVSKDSVPPMTDTERLRLTPRHFAYLRISEGCDNCCSYCSIPLIRGPLRSKPLGAIVREARELLTDGAAELILIAQDTTSYGRDRKGKRSAKKDLVDVLRKLDRLKGLTWLRLLYTHPASFSDRLVQAYADLEHLLPYVDLPLQHIADPILQSMGRRTTRARIEQLI